MSQAFVREGEDPISLDEISPTLNALSHFLTRENNGIRVFEKRTDKDQEGNELHIMSNGLAYKKNTNGKWEVA